MKRSYVLALCLLVGSLSPHSSMGQTPSGTTADVDLKIPITNIRNEKGQIIANISAHGAGCSAQWPSQSCIPLSAVIKLSVQPLQAPSPVPKIRDSAPVVH
jgi:hypothetical protein